MTGMNREFNRRVRILIALSLTFLSIFTLRLIDVQAVQAGGYSSMAHRELTYTSTLLAPRGTISDSRGVVLARSVAAVNIVVDQTQISDPAATAALAAPILNLSTTELLPLLSGKKRYQVIVKNAQPAVWIALQAAVKSYNDLILKTKDGVAHRIIGFYSERSYVRDYPTGSLAASLIGITNDAGVGAGGIEASMNSILTGQDGQYDFANGDGAIIPGSQQVITPAKAGTSVTLTIDRDVQWVAQNEISNAVKKAHATSGTVIVMDAQTGAILAQASAPTFDPANMKTFKVSMLNNPAVQDVFEPGSTGKIITMSAAMQEGKITPTTVLTVPYKLKVGGSTFQDHEFHKTLRLTTTGALAISSNTAAIQVGERLSNDTLYSYLQRFGIGSTTGSHLPGESAGILHPVSQWSATSAPTIAFGQGYSVTALQATSVFATIANNGVRVTPNVIAGYTDSSGNYTPSAPSSSTRVVSADVAQKMRMMMESVVSANGTAPEAAIPGYRVAGKTGTAMKYQSSCNCYRGYTASFIGFAPADNPKYVVSAVIQNPQGDHFGGTVAAPVFKNVMSFVLQSERIPPTKSTATAYPLSEAELLATPPQGLTLPQQSSQNNSAQPLTKTAPHLTLKVSKKSK